MNAGWGWSTARGGWLQVRRGCAVAAAAAAVVHAQAQAVGGKAVHAQAVHAQAVRGPKGVGVGVDEMRAQGKHVSTPQYGHRRHPRRAPNTPKQNTHT